MDLRFTSKESLNGGSILVVIAPVLRFAEIGFNADVKIDQLANPYQIISGFGPELLGYPLDEVSKPLGYLQVAVAVRTILI